VGQLEALLDMFGLAQGCDTIELERTIKKLGLRDFERAVDAGRDYT